MDLCNEYSLFKQQQLYITDILKNNKEHWDQRQNKTDTQVEEKPTQSDVEQVNFRSATKVPDTIQLTARHVPLRYSSFHSELLTRRRNHKPGKSVLIQHISTEEFNAKLKFLPVKEISGEYGFVVSPEQRYCPIGKDTYKNSL